MENKRYEDVRHPDTRDDHDRIIKLEGKVEVLEHFNTEVRLNYITRIEFTPVQKIVFSMVGLVLITIAAAVLKLVLMSQK